MVKKEWGNRREEGEGEEIMEKTVKRSKEEGMGKVSRRRPFSELKNLIWNKNESLDRLEKHVRVGKVGRPSTEMEVWTVKVS